MFKQVHGHTNVPAKFKENPQLGEWVKRQRWASNQRSRYRKERYDKLQGIGFIFHKPSRVGFGQNATLWEERFNELKEFKNKNGHTNVPVKFKDNPQLGRWVQRQRALYRRGRELTQQRIDKLQGIGFIFDMHAVRWEERFTELKEFRKKNSHTNVTRNFKDNHPLGKWVHKQRSLYSNGTLTQEPA